MRRHRCVQYMRCMRACVPQYEHMHLCALMRVSARMHACTWAFPKMAKPTCMYAQLHTVCVHACIISSGCMRGPVHVCACIDVPYACQHACVTDDAYPSAHASTRIFMSVQYERLHLYYIHTIYISVSYTHLTLPTIYSV